MKQNNTTSYARFFGKLENSKIDGRIKGITETLYNRELKNPNGSSKLSTAIEAHIKSLQNNTKQAA